MALRPVTSPDFDLDLGPEVEAAMAEHRAAVEAIATGPWPPSFEDTIAALVRAGRRVHRAEQLFDDAATARSTPAIQALEAELRPRLAAHRDAVALDPRLLRRIADLAARADELGLGEEERCVLERYHRDLVRAGATLGAGDQERLRAINERLSALEAEFRRRLLEETRALAVHVPEVDALDGLPAAMVDEARRAALARGEDGYLLTHALNSAHPALQHLRDRGLRERLWRAAIARGRRGGENDNRPVVAEIAALRAERAGLLGYRSHAEYAIADETVGGVDAVERLLTEVGTAAEPVARAESERHAAALHADGHDGPLEPWDWPYYAARDRRERYALDEARLREHFVLERVFHDGLFDVAGRLFGLRFEALDDAPRPHPDMWVWAVRDEDGSDRGRLYVDPFSREGKGGGAWMGAYAEPSPLTDEPAMVLIQLNATRPADGAPVLLTPLDVRILFHEFGHALQMLLSDVTYPRIAGINVAVDVVEFASRLVESMAIRPEVLARYARHHATGEPLSDADVEALNASVRDEAAANSVRAVAGDWLDQAWHGLAPGATVDDADAFEAAVVERHGPHVPGLALHYRSTFFDHIFVGQYGGTQYGYLWSAVLEAIAAEWLDEQGGITPAAGRRLREELLSRGRVVDPIAAFRAITGREPSVEPMLRRRGFV